MILKKENAHPTLECFKNQIEDRVGKIKASIKSETKTTVDYIALIGRYSYYIRITKTHYNSNTYTNQLIAFTHKGIFLNKQRRLEKFGIN